MMASLIDSKAEIGKVESGQYKTEGLKAAKSKLEIEKIESRNSFQLSRFQFSIVAFGFQLLPLVLLIKVTEEQKCGKRKR